MLEIKEIEKSFGENKVLDKLNLVLRPGEVNGVVGKNGAGKTTLFKCIAGLNSYEGEIVYNTPKIKNVLGYLETNPFYLSKLTGREYLQLLCNARFMKAENFELSNIFDLPLDEYASNYSTGMKKKLCLTGLLIQKNEIYLLDEPFNGVDLQSNIMIKEIIQRLKSKGKIVLVSSHIFSSLLEICDHVHYLKEGKIFSQNEKEGFQAIEEDMRSDDMTEKLKNLDL